MYDLPDALILPIVTKIHPLNYMLLTNLDIPKANRAQLRGSRTSTLIVPVTSTVGLVHLCSCAISFQQTSRHTDLALAAHHPSQLDRHGIRIYHTEHYRGEFRFTHFDEGCALGQRYIGLEGMWAPFYLSQREDEELISKK